MTQRTEQDQFVDALRDQWEAQVAQEGENPSYSFNGWTGDDYNGWLAHRHGWPVTPEGWCGPSWASVMDEGEPHMEIPYAECDVCMDIVQQYRGKKITIEASKISNEDVLKMFLEGEQSV